MNTLFHKNVLPKGRFVLPGELIMRTFIAFKFTLTALIAINSIGNSQESAPKAEAAGCAPCSIDFVDCGNVCQTIRHVNYLHPCAGFNQIGFVAFQEPLVVRHSSILE